MLNLANIFEKNKDKAILSKDELAAFLKTTPEALEAFENAYKMHVMDDNAISDNLFRVNAKQATELNHESEYNPSVDTIVDRIVNELLAQTSIYSYDGVKEHVEANNLQLPDSEMVTSAEIMALPEQDRPMLTGNLIQKDINDDTDVSILVFLYKSYLTEKNPAKKQRAYHMFRQGLDILDLDPIAYEMLGMNRNAMGNWFPQLVEAVTLQDFFKLPKTKIMKVPITLLQLTRLSYRSLTPTTLKIIDDFCFKAFGLDETKDYFIKTGTYSSKYDFRNAHVHGAKEVHELGEYLTFIQFQAQQMASPLSQPCIYGVSTTNEWVVREFIKDKEDNPCIYNGMPLHTEYRVFVDFDTQEILGVNPYWDPNVMKQRFGHESDANDPEKVHDYVIYRMHEEKLMKRYNDNKDIVVNNIEKMLPDVNLSGQWSIDVMQNGDDFYIIDMALAANSALNSCVPAEKLHTPEENWIPKIG